MMFNSGFSPIAYNLVQRRKATRLVAIHGKESPFRTHPELAEQYETGIRLSLDRVNAEYALNIPFNLAYYADLWRSTGRALWDTAASSLRHPLFPSHPLLSLIPDANQRNLEVAIASEFLDNAEITLDRPYRTFDRSTFNQLLTEAEDHIPDVSQRTMLYQFVTGTAQFLSNASLRAMAVERLANEIENGGDGSVVLLAHGLGTLVGYHLLMKYPKLPVRAFITFGSPMGLQSVMGALSEQDDLFGGGETLPFPTGLSRWINLYQRSDVVASPLEELYLPTSSRDGRRVEDIALGNPRSLHTCDLFTGHYSNDYIASKSMGKYLRSLVED